MPDVATLQRRFTIASEDQRRRSPFNTGLLARIAERPDIVEILQAAPEEQQLPVLLLASVHSIVLAEPWVDLAAWYPTVSATPRDDDPFPAFARFCIERGDELRAIVSSHSTQTNEVGRCALFLPALARLEASQGPLGVVDVGTSAGLNLQLDRYAYDYDGRAIGGPSEVGLPCGVRGDVPLPIEVPTVADRLGIDRSPVDLTDAADVRWLMACVWPDQLDRFERLRRAIEIARRHPPRIMTGDATATVGAAIDALAPHAHPVVLTSWVLNYLTADDRMAFVAELDRIGTRRDVTWLLLESPGLCAGLPFPDGIAGSFLTHLVEVQWREGARTVTHLAECHPHGYWLHWV